MKKEIPSVIPLGFLFSCRRSTQPDREGDNGGRPAILVARAFLLLAAAFAAPVAHTVGKILIEYWRLPLAQFAQPLSLSCNQTRQVPRGPLIIALVSDGRSSVARCRGCYRVFGLAVTISPGKALRPSPRSSWNAIKPINVWNRVSCRRG
jgi:hypothetical protein